MPDNLIIILALTFIVLIFEIVCTWIVYKKAGIPGWKSIIPIYNIFVLFELANVRKWMFLLLFIPILNLYILYIIYTSLAKRLGKGKVFGILLVFLPFIAFPILAFTKSSLKSMYMNIEEEFKMEQTPLVEGPIEPLGAMPDIEEDDDILFEEESIPTSFNEMTPDMVTSNIVAPTLSEPYLEPIEALNPIHVVDPLTAQQKVQHIEEEKEVYPDVDIYKTCPNCGTKVEPSATACFLCGKRFEE